MAEMGDIQGAAEWYDKAIEADPKDASSFLNDNMMIFLKYLMQHNYIDIHAYNWQIFPYLVINLIM